MLRRPLSELTLAAALLLTCGIALAASTTANLSVQAAVSNNCTVFTTGILDFGAYDPIGTNATTDKTGTGTITVACTKGATGLTIGMGLGGNPNGTQRQMSAGGTDRLPYNLFLPSGTTPGAVCIYTAPTAWTNAVGGLLALSPPLDKNSHNYNVCGSIPQNQDVAPGTYADTVTATLTF